MIGKIIFYIFIIILVAATLIFSYIFVLEYKSFKKQTTFSSREEPSALNQTSQEPKISEETELSYTEQKQFYPNMRYRKKEISYKIDLSCSEEKIKRVQEAFQLLENKTGILKFNEAENAEIAVSCTETEIIEGASDYFVAGEGGATSIVNATLFYVIETGKVLLFYKEAECSWPNIELHEILHALGFAHSEKENSMMYNTSSCSQIITQDITNELIRLYSFYELPELAVLNITATKHSLYLDFTIEFANFGLKNAENIVLEIYEDDKKIKDFDLKELNYGERKILNVENMWLGLGADKLTFLIVTGPEFDKTNNKAEISFE